jgi:GT2 family glycosyltransferase/glycosyltransferase involved in cell wall biosynthesis
MGGGASGRASHDRASLAVLIVGMHRSGTSALGGVLELLGVPAPEQQVTTDHHNARGYFEPQRIVDFHEALFARLGSPSNDPLPVEYGWLDGPVGRAAAQELAELLDDEFGAEPVRLFKDPRMCRLLPVWTEALKLAGRPAVAILPTRDPLEVAGSLAAKAGLSQPHSLFMWLQHVILGERFSRGMARSFTLYDDLMADWRGVVAKLETDLGLAWPRDMVRAAPEIDAFLTGELRHHAGGTALDARDPLQALCLRAWAALEALRADANDARAMAALDAVAADFHRGLEVYGPLVAAFQRDVNRFHITRGEVIERDRIIAEQAAGLRRDQETEKALETVRARLAYRDNELRIANDGVRDRDRQIRERDELVKRLEDERREWERKCYLAEVARIEVADRLYALETSGTWRATHLARRLLTKLPFLRVVARKSARLAWWTASGNLGRNLLALDGVVLPRPAPAKPDFMVEEEEQAAEAAAATTVGPLRVAFLSGEPDTPGHKYRVVRMAEAVQALGGEPTIVRLADAGANLDHFETADLVYIWRAAWDEDNVAPVVENARKRGAPVVFDIDDLIVEPALVGTDLIDGLRSQNHDLQGIMDFFERLQKTLAAADYACTPTPFLTQYVQRYSSTPVDKVAFRIPNGFDEAFVKKARLAARTRRSEPKDGLVRIGYATGSKTHQADFAKAAPAVARILREHPEARLVAFTGQWGPVLDLAEFPEFDGLAGQVEWRQFVPIADLPFELARFDINLAPLEVGNIFCEAKSELKYFESALVDTPTVASPTEPYRIAIEHGVSGFLADSTEEWYAALKALMDDPALRRSMARTAQFDSIVRYGPERRAEMFESLLAQTLQRGRTGARAFAGDLRRGPDAAPPRPVTPDHEVVFETDMLREAEATVVVPLYNYARFVVEALDSVRDQTVRPLDLVVVDDASTDDSAEVALAWMRANSGEFNRLLLVRNRRNAGLAHSRNVGFANADTPFVLPLDADNRLRPKALERLLHVLQPSNAAFAYPLSEEFGELEPLAEGEQRLPMGSAPYDPARFRNANFIDAMALVRRSAWAAVGGYDHIRFGWEDYDFWCKLAEQGMYGEQVAETLADYRVHKGSMLRSQTDIDENKRRLIADIERRHPWLRVAEAGRDAAADKPH